MAAVLNYECSQNEVSESYFTNKYLTFQTALWKFAFKCKVCNTHISQYLNSF